MSEFENGLSSAEAERLACLAEEAGEVIQVVGKILRHGYESCNPFDSCPIPNRSLLEKELGDLSAIIDLMIARKDLSKPQIDEGSRRKSYRMKPFLHHQEVPE